MNLKITSQINTSVGKPITNAICFVNANSDYLLSQGKMFIDCEFYVDMESKTNKYDRIIPVVLNDSEIIVNRIGGFEILFSSQDLIDFTLLMPFTKVKNYLEDTYGWLVTIEQ